MRRFFAEPGQFVGESVTLGPEESRHLRDVLRLNIGDHARVFDGEGHEFMCEIADAGKHGTVLRVVRPVEPAAPESMVELTIVASAYKSDHLDEVVRMAVELGAARFVPVVTHRSEVRLQDIRKREGRWRKIALEATKQCERAKLMLVSQALVFGEFLEGVTEGDGLRLIFSEKGGAALPASTDQKRITALIGPKGGWEDSELDSASKKGFRSIKLGRRILKADTAAITFAALVQHRFGDLN